MSRPKVRIKDVWFSAGLGAMVIILAQIINQSFNGFSIIIGSITLPLGYLLVVYILDNYFDPVWKEDKKRRKDHADKPEGEGIQ